MNAITFPPAAAGHTAVVRVVWSTLMITRRETTISLANSRMRGLDDLDACRRIIAICELGGLHAAADVQILSVTAAGE